MACPELPRSGLDDRKALLRQFAALVPKLDGPGAGNELPIVIEPVIRVALLADGLRGAIKWAKTRLRLPESTGSVGRKSLCAKDAGGVKLPRVEDAGV